MSAFRWWWWQTRTRWRMRNWDRRHFPGCPARYDRKAECMDVDVPGWCKS